MNIRIEIYILLNLFVAMLIASCSKQQEMDNKEYIKWVQSYGNGLHVKKIVQPYVFDVQYWPPAYRWLQMQGKNLSDKQDLEHILEDELQYYLLRIGFEDKHIDFIKRDSKDKKVWEERTYYFSYRFQEHIYLEEGDLKLSCELYHFERAFDLRPERVFVLGFASDREIEIAKLVIESAAFGSQPIKIPVSKMNIPTLKL